MAIVDIGFSEDQLRAINIVGFWMEAFLYGTQRPGHESLVVVDETHQVFA
jgi:hypothetical protein